MTLCKRYQDIRRRIVLSAEAAGRRPQDITLVGVCKRQSFERIQEAYDCGLRDFGENTVQGMCKTEEKFSDAGLTAVRWHFVGALQRNKVKVVVQQGALVQSVGSMKTAEAISVRSIQSGVRTDVLVQVNVGHEPQKSGVSPDLLLAFCQDIIHLQGLRFQGLMALPPKSDAPKEHFQMLKKLLCDVQRHVAGARSAMTLSMGMSEDFEEAIAHGSTMVRVGTALFGPRNEGDLNEADIH